MILTNIEIEQQFQEAQAAFDSCEAIIKKHSKTFYRAFSRLPRQKALSVYAVYAFCREADDSIDVYHDLKRLEKLEQDFRLFLAGENLEAPLWQALKAVFLTYPMEEAAFFDMIKGQKMDAAFQQPQNQTELENYCYYVASTVGLMLLPIISKEPEAIQKEAKALGIAMQLTNILRDIGEDFRDERIYLPKELLDHYQYSKADFINQTIDLRFEELWEYEATRAEALYQQAIPMFNKIDEDCREALYLALVLYREILSSVRENGYQCFQKKNYVKKQRQLALYTHARKVLDSGIVY